MNCSTVEELVLPVQQQCHLEFTVLWQPSCFTVLVVHLVWQVQRKPAAGETGIQQCQHLPRAQLDGSSWTAKHSKHLLFLGVTVQKLLCDVQINVLKSSAGEFDSNLHM